MRMPKRGSTQSGTGSRHRKRACSSAAEKAPAARALIVEADDTVDAEPEEEDEAEEDSEPSEPPARRLTGASLCCSSAAKLLLPLAPASSPPLPFPEREELLRDTASCTCTQRSASVSHLLRSKVAFGRLAS